MIAKRLLIAGVMASTLGIGGEASAVTAMSFAMDFKGYVTMLNGRNGSAFRNLSLANEPIYMGYRTPINGRMIMDIDERGLRGAATFEPFLFVGTMASGRDVSFVPVATLLNIPTNTLLVGNMSFDFGSLFKGIPVSIVLDMGNLTTALMSSNVGDVITGTMRAASDNTVFTLPDGTQTTLPLGPVVVATTTWDTTDVDTDGDGQPGPLTNDTNPSGTVPLLVDTRIDQTNGDVGIGGSPIKAVSFVGYSPNFDITEITVTCVMLVGSCSETGVPVPEIPLSAEPLDPLLQTGGALLKKLGL